MRLIFLLLILLLVSACVPDPQGRAQTADARNAPEPRRSQTLPIVVRVEPVGIASLPLTASGAGVGFITRTFNAQLDMVDVHDRPLPYLAEQLPELKGPALGARIPDAQIWWNLHEWELGRAD